VPGSELALNHHMVSSPGVSTIHQSLDDATQDKYLLMLAGLKMCMTRLDMLNFIDFLTLSFCYDVQTMCVAFSVSAVRTRTYVDGRTVSTRPLNCCSCYNVSIIIT
jgi:hypothetical protein